MYKAENIIIAGLTVIVAGISLIGVNAAFSTKVVVGEPYDAPYRHCAQWVLVHKGQACSRYETRTEKRQNTRVEGLFWNYDSYNVVR